MCPRFVSLAAERSDEALLEDFLRGDRDAFDVLVRRHEDAVFAVALRLMGQRADAFDAVQETFVAVFQRAHSFRGEAAFSTWLHRITINACKDLIRKRGRFTLENDDATERPDPGGDVASKVVAHVDLAAALAKLPEDQRIALVMFDLGGIPYDEIARETATNIGTVKSRISRARRALAEAMEQAAPSGTSKG
jgi:RNA polymerase sigma-70 factor (ECF subfamily)